MHELSICRCLVGLAMKAKAAPAARAAGHTQATKAEAVSASLHSKV